VKKFWVWEPALESVDKATIVESESHGQAAFVAASERVESIGYRSATLLVFDGEELRSVEIEARTWYAVKDVSDPIPYVTTKNDAS